MHNFRRQSEFVTNDSPGFGASHTDQAGEIVAGNTSDYAYVHGKAIMKAGYPFFSCSNETFCSDSTFRQAAWGVDLVCGKQVTTVVGSGLQKKYEVFPDQMQSALSAFTADGGNVLVSGAYIGTDIWDQLYPVKIDKDFRKKSIEFAQEVLGYKWQSGFASRSGDVTGFGDWKETIKDMQFHNSQNSISYCIIHLIQI